MPGILNYHTRALASELEKGLPVPESGFTAEIFREASRMRVLAGPLQRKDVYLFPSPLYMRQDKKVPHLILVI